MARIVLLFWNPADRRLRALWRLILHLLLMGVGALLLALALAGPIEQILSGLSRQQYLLAESAVESLFGGLAIVVATLVAAYVLDRRPFLDFGFHFNRRWWLDFGFGLGLGALLMCGVFLVEWAAGWISIRGTFYTALETPFRVAILFPLLLFFGVGIYEELLSRGYHLRNMAEGLSFRPLGAQGGAVLALLLSSSIFGALHLGNPNASAISTVNIALAGIFLGLPVLLTGELAISIGIHITWNFFQGNVFGFPVSGTPANTTTFIAIEQGGPALWTGAAFGPEAGLLGVAAMLLGSLLIVLWVHGRYGAVRVQNSVAQYRRQDAETEA